MRERRQWCRLSPLNGASCHQSTTKLSFRTDFNFCRPAEPRTYHSQQLVRTCKRTTPALSQCPVCYRGDVYGSERFQQRPSASRRSFAMFDLAEDGKRSGSPWQLTRRAEKTWPSSLRCQAQHSWEASPRGRRCSRLGQDAERT